jgi:tetratricopeptide (TPR) repeat protein
VAVSIRRVAAQHYIESRADAVRKMLSKTPGGTILIFGYSCSDRFDISPAIRSVRESPCRIIYLNHTKDRSDPCLRKLAELHPEHALASLNSQELRCNADDLVEAIWLRAFQEPAPPLDLPADAWLADIGEWTRGLGDYGKGFLSYLSGLLHKAANNWARSNELIKISLAQGLDDLLRVRSYLALGNNSRDLNELTRASEYLNVALKDAVKFGFVQEETRALNSLGIVAADQHDYDAAIELYQRAIQKAQSTKDQELEGKCHGNIGILLKNRRRPNDLTDALLHQIHALRLSREIGDKRSEGRTLGNIGIAYSDLGYKQVAQGFYAEAQEIARALGDLLHVGIWLHNAGEDALGFDRSLGEQLLRDAMRTFRDLGKEDLATEAESVLKTSRLPESP